MYVVFVVYANHIHTQVFIWVKDKHIMGLELLWNIIYFFATAIWYLLISCLTKTESLENKFSFAPKNERKYFCISALAYKKHTVILEYFNIKE